MLSRKKYFWLPLMFAVHAVCAQSTSTLMGARAAGMGYASSTHADEWSLFNNVAGLAGLQHTAAIFSCDVSPGLPGSARIAVAFGANTRTISWAAGFFRFGDDVYNEQIATAAFAHKTGNTSLGFKVNYVQYQAEGFGTNGAVTIDFGGITQITKQISVGAYITNLTQSRVSGEYLPVTMVAGAGFRPSEKILVVTEFDKDIDYPVTWRTGLEYAVYNKVFFRTGFNLNPDAAYVGLGAQKKNLKFDYGLRLLHLLGAFHQASIVYCIPSKPRK